MRCLSPTLSFTMQHADSARPCRKVTHASYKHTCCSRSLVALPDASRPSRGWKPARGSTQKERRQQTLKRQRDPSYTPSAQSMGSVEPNDGDDDDSHSAPAKRLKSVDASTPSRSSTPAPSQALTTGFVRILLNLNDVQTLLSHVNAVVDCFRLPALPSEANDTAMTTRGL